MRAAIYARISRDPRGERLGVTRQRSDCEALCERLGWTVADIHVDNDASAYSGKPRPAYAAMMAGLKAGHYDAIVAWHPDRLHRAPRELEDFIDALDAAGATVATVTAGDYDLATPEGRLVARIVGAVARQESEHKSRRAKRKAAELAERGLLGGGGTRPFGFDDDRLTIRADEARLIRAAARRIVNGGSLRSIAADWNARGVPSVTGRPWNTHVLRRILCSPRIAGQRQHQGRIVGDAAWKPIIDPATSARVRAILLDPKRRTNTTSRRYLLTGLAVCSDCGHTLVARPTADRRRKYVCASGPNFGGCGKRAILAEPFENHVVRLAAIALRDAVARPPTVDVDRLATGIDDLTARLAALAVDHYDTRLIGRTEYLAAADALRARQEALRAELRAASAADAATVALPTGADLGALDFDRQRIVLEAVIERVELGAAVAGRNRFDPDRVHIVWRV